MMSQDMELLRDYVDCNSEDAFATLVSRHINLVYSVALRQVTDPNKAEEITQAVFIVLARKAASLEKNTILASWLCRAARYLALDAQKLERRRRQRESEAHMRFFLHQSEPDSWIQIAPLLDAAMARLRTADHDALVLRFFDKKSFQEVASILGVSENAAKMRVGRAIDKLRKDFLKSGVTISAGTLIGVIGSNSIQAAPASAIVASTAMAIKGAAVTGTTANLTANGLKFMAFTKIKKALAIGAVVFLAAGITATTVWCTIPFKFREFSYSTPMSHESLILKHVDSGNPVASHLRGVTDFVHKLGPNLKIEKFTRNINLPGSRFVPMFSTGKVPYRIEVTFSDDRSIKYAAIFAGDIDFEARGLVSPRYLRNVVQKNLDGFLQTVFWKSPAALKALGYPQQD